MDNTYSEYIINLFIMLVGSFKNLSQCCPQGLPIFHVKISSADLSILYVQGDQNFIKNSLKDSEQVQTRMLSNE
jgi:hypothetical protein